MSDERNERTEQSRRNFLRLSAGAAAGLAAHAEAHGNTQQSSQHTDRKPNFLILIGEGVRSDEFSYAGNPIIQTPNLDRVAVEGINFKNSFCINALCSPSRAAILTGLYSHTTGCLDNHNRHIPDNDPIFTDLLHQAGYETACFGKAHIREALMDHSWDYYFGFDHAATSYYHPRIVEGSAGQYEHPKEYVGYVDDLVTDKAVNWLSQKRDKPFLCLFMFQAPHGPFLRSRRNLDLYNGVPISKPSTFDDDLHGDYYGKPRVFAKAKTRIGTSELGHNDPRSLEEVVKDHYAGVVNNDQNFHSLLKVLEKQGQLDDTVVLLTSDHGFFLGEWRLYDKRFMHEPSIRVPLAIRYPKLIQAGSVVEKMALNLDLAPTILDLAGVETPKQMQGSSLVPFLRGSAPATWRKDWLYEYYELGP
ncbi:MAG: sulfatase-like hydrolase/transferase, partial [Terriglobia bacterium]